jgi:dTDP-4-dehydrorhamnose 3,5-epimerase
LEGAVFDVAVDIRVGSPTFGKWYGIILDGISKRQMYIPEGFAHGFVVLSDSAIFAYKCTAYYAPQNEFSLLWNDPSINITWPIDDPSLSLKDSQGLTLNELKHQGCLPQYKLAQHKPEHIGKQSEYLDTEINDYNLQEKIAAGI